MWWQEFWYIGQDTGDRLTVLLITKMLYYAPYYKKYNISYAIYLALAKTSWHTAGRRRS
jgi:hypothetical protein